MRYGFLSLMERFSRDQTFPATRRGWSAPCLAAPASHEPEPALVSTCADVPIHRGLPQGHRHVACAGERSTTAPGRAGQLIVVQPVAHQRGLPGLLSSFADVAVRGAEPLN